MIFILFINALFLEQFSLKSVSTTCIITWVLIQANMGITFKTTRPIFQHTVHIHGEFALKIIHLHTGLFNHTFFIFLSQHQSSTIRSYPSVITYKCYISPHILDYFFVNIKTLFI